MAKDKAKIYVAQCPIYTLWFERFTRGFHTIVGNDRHPDTVVSVKLTRVLMNRAHYDFLDTDDKVL